MSEENVITALGPGQAQTPGGVGPDTPASHGVIQRGGHDEDRLPNPRRPRPLWESWETQCVRLPNVILAIGTVCQVGVMCWRISD